MEEEISFAIVAMEKLNFVKSISDLNTDSLSSAVIATSTGFLSAFLPPIPCALTQNGLNKMDNLEEHAFMSSLSHSAQPKQIAQRPIIHFYPSINHVEFEIRWNEICFAAKHTRRNKYRSAPLSIIIYGTESLEPRLFLCHNSHHTHDVATTTTTADYRNPNKIVESGRLYPYKRTHTQPQTPYVRTSHTDTLRRRSTVARQIETPEFIDRLWMRMTICSERKKWTEKQIWSDWSWAMVATTSSMNINGLWMYSKPSQKVLFLFSSMFSVVLRFLLVFLCVGGILLGLSMETFSFR